VTPAQLRRIEAGILRRLRTLGTEPPVVVPALRPLRQMRSRTHMQRRSGERSQMHGPANARR
jgi:hypothetical protein